MGLGSWNLKCKVAHSMLLLLLLVSSTTAVHLRLVRIGRQPLTANDGKHSQQPNLRTEFHPPVNLQALGNIPLDTNKGNTYPIIPLGEDIPLQHRGLNTNAPLPLAGQPNVNPQPNLQPSPQYPPFQPQPTIPPTAPPADQSFRPLTSGSFVPSAGPPIPPSTAPNYQPIREQQPVTQQPLVTAPQITVPPVPSAPPAPSLPPVQTAPTVPQHIPPPTTPATYFPIIPNVFGNQPFPFTPSQPPFPTTEVNNYHAGFPKDHQPRLIPDEEYSIFARREFGFPPSPKELGFPGISDTHENYIYDIDWSRFRRRKRSTSKKSLPVYDDNIAAESRPEGRRQQRAEAERKPRSEYKQEYDGPYIYTQLFGPPYEVGYIRSPIPSKHIYEDYLQFVRSWSAGSRDAVDAQLKANPEAIHQYKSPPSHSAPAAVSYNSVKDDYKKDDYQLPSHTSPKYEKPAYPEPSYDKKDSYQEATYSTPGYKEPIYTTPKYKEPSHTTPGYKEPAYKEPSYTTPKYKEPVYNEPVALIYKEPSYTTPGYKPEPAYKEPAYKEPSYTTPGYKEPAYKEPAYKEPAYNEPSYTTPGYKEPAYKEPSYTTPGYKEPAYKEPAYKEPTYKEPSYTTPGYKEPAYKEPVYKEPAYKEPAYKEPVYTTPKYKEPAPVPAYTTPAYKEPAYKEPSYTTPGYKEPAYKEPSYTTPGYKEPAYKEPVYKESAYKEPTYTTPGYKEPVYTTPKYKEPVYTTPKYKEPVYTTPKYKEPVYTTPKYKEPVYTTPKPYSAPVYEDKNHGGNKYDAPKSGYEPPKSDYSPPAYDKPKYEEPKYEKPYEPPKAYVETGFVPSKGYLPVKDNYDAKPPAASYSPPAPSYDPPKAFDVIYEAPKAYDAPKNHDILKYDTPKYDLPKSYDPPKYEAPTTFDPSKYDTPKLYDAPKAYEPPKYDAPKAYEPPKYDAPKAYEPPKYDAPKAYEPPKYEAPKAYEPPKYEAPKAYEPPKYEAPKAYEPPKYEAPKQDYGPKPVQDAYKADYDSGRDYTTPKYSPPVYESPKHSSPSYDLPKYTTPSYDIPKLSTASYGTSGSNFVPPYNDGNKGYDAPSKAHNGPSYEAPAPGYKESYTTPYRELFTSPAYKETYSTPAYVAPAYKESYTTPSYKGIHSSTTVYKDGYSTPAYKETYSTPAPTYNNNNGDNYDVELSSTNYKQAAQNYDNTKNDYKVPVYETPTKNDDYGKDKPYSNAGAPSHDTKNGRPHYPVIIGRYQVTDSKAFLPVKVDGKGGGEYKGPASHVHGANGEEYVVYYLPYGQPLPVPLKKRSDTVSEPIIRTRRSSRSRKDFLKRQRSAYGIVTAGRGDDSQTVTESTSSPVPSQPKDSVKETIVTTESTSIETTTSTPSIEHISSLSPLISMDQAAIVLDTHILVDSNHDNNDSPMDKHHSEVSSTTADHSLKQDTAFQSKQTHKTEDIPVNVISVSHSSSAQAIETEGSNADFSSAIQTTPEISGLILMEQDSAQPNVENDQHSMVIMDNISQLDPMMDVMQLEENPPSEMNVQDLPAMMAVDPQQDSGVVILEMDDDMLPPSQDSLEQITDVRDNTVPDRGMILLDVQDDSLPPNGHYSALIIEFDSNINAGVSGVTILDSSVLNENNEPIESNLPNDDDIDMTHAFIPVDVTDEDILSMSLNDKTPSTPTVNLELEQEKTSEPLNSPIISDPIPETQTSTENSNAVQPQTTVPQFTDISDDSKASSVPETSLPTLDNLPEITKDVDHVTTPVPIETPVPVKESSESYHSGKDDSNRSEGHSIKEDEEHLNVFTETPKILPGLTQRPVKYLKPPGLGSDEQRNWNGFSSWWTKLGNRVAKVYNYE